MDFLIFFLIIISFVFVTGVCIGSFLNVVVLRAFSNESIAYPASKCPLCQKPLKWYHNIPVISYICLSGKCAYCKDPISIQYPIVELVTGFLFVAIFIKFGLTLNTLFMMAFASLFVVMATTDIREKVVFDFHTYTLAILGVIYNLLNVGHVFGQKVFAVGHVSFAVNNSIIDSILGLLAGIVIMELLARFGYVVAKTRAFGEGDTYIAAGLGAVFGLNNLITILVYSLIIQIVLTLPIFFKKLYDNKDFKTIISFVGFFLVVCSFRLLDNLGLLSNMLVLGFFVFLLCALGIYVCKRILGGIKTPENLTYLPFGPAMVFAGFIVMFMIQF